MNTDHDFQIGKDHKICQDYAMSGKFGDDFAYAIVCDGCSASPDVDFGARVVAMAARGVLHNISNTHGYVPGCPLIASEILGKIRHTLAASLHLHPHTFDATLLIAWVTGGELTAYLWGDGVFVHRGKRTYFSSDPSIQAISIECSENAPDYLSYHLDETRRSNYVASGVSKIAKDSVSYSSGAFDPKGTAFMPQPILQPYIIKRPVSQGDIIALISDGIHSFTKGSSESIPMRDLVDEFTGFKNFEGTFAHRRLSAFRRKCAKEQVTHSDDISITAIHV